MIDLGLAMNKQNVVAYFFVSFVSHKFTVTRGTDISHGTPIDNSPLNLDLEELQDHLDMMEGAIGRANVCLENTEISLSKRENDPPSEICGDYAPSLQFESGSCHI